MKTQLKIMALAALLTLMASDAWAQSGRQYYGDWHYYPDRGYHTRKYFYRPVATVVEYHYHYCVYYPTQPRYIYFYNPIRRVYWGRFDIEGKKGAEYSLLEEKDRKERLADIDESAFPKPGKMPTIPGAEDNTPIKPPPRDRPKSNAARP